MADAFIAECVGRAAKAVIDDFSIHDDSYRKVFDPRCNTRSLGEKLLAELEAAGYRIVKAPPL